MLVLIPILIMLALEFIVPGKKRITATSFFFLVGGGFFLFLLLRFFVPTAWIYPEGDAVTRVRGQVEHLLSTKDWQKKPVIILEGSSATHYGINGALLEKLLAAQDMPVTVLQFSLSGANHFERLFMLQVFLEEMGARHCEELKKAPTLLLSEVFDAYDQEPLYLWQKEAYSARAFVWTTPRNLLAAWQGVGEQGSYFWSLLEHLLLHQFSVGIFSSMQPLNYRKKMESFFPLTGTKKTFHYAEAQKTFEKAITAPAVNAALSLPGWKSYYQELHQEFGEVVGFMGFYALPTLEAQRGSYQLAFAHCLPSRTTMLGPASPAFMKSLLHEEIWFDGVHPQSQGALLFTQWLADEIVKNWSQLLARPW